MLDAGAPPVVDTRKLTLFQEFIRDGYGVTPSIFGNKLFMDRQRYEPVAGAPVPSDYTIGPGDEVVVHVGGAMEQTIRATVDRDGRLMLPRIGPVVVAGTHASDLDGLLQRQFGEVLRNFSISTSLGRLRSINVYVVGQAAIPGLHTVSSLSTLINAVFTAGGPAPTGSMRVIQLRRHDKLITTLDLYQFIRGGDTSKDMRLEAGDVIVVPPAGPRVALLGTLDNPTIVELLPQGEPLKDVLAVVGMPSSLTAQDKVIVDRIIPANGESPRQILEVALDHAGLETMLADSDVLRLLPISQGFANSVTLRGNVAQPLRRAWHTGMTLSDLIPDRQALLTREYYVRRNQAVSAKTAGQTDDVQLIDTGISSLDEPNWEYAIVERLDRTTLKTDIVPFNLGRLFQNDLSANLKLQPGDVVTIFGKRDLLMPQGRQSQFVRVEGEVEAPGLYELHPGETLPNLVARAGGLTPNAYLFGSEFYRESTRRRQREMLDEAIGRSEAQLASRSATAAANLTSTDAAQAQAQQAGEIASVRAQLQRMRSMQPTGRIALELQTTAHDIDELPGLPLEDGDRIRVPSRPGFVYAVGAVDNRNALIWQRGRVLGDYLKRSGINPDADEQNLFVLRADGSVVTPARRFWSSSIDSLELMPGDTLVVPEKVNRETAWTVLVRGLRDWSQILGQFGLAAAAVEVLRTH